MYFCCYLVLKGELKDILFLVSFEDRRKENFDRGQAELERRRKALEDAQKREREERERKEREEMERQEKIRLEQERRKHEELQRQLEKQRELEVEREKERLRQIEQREAARRFFAFFLLTEIYFLFFF